MVKTGTNLLAESIKNRRSQLLTKLKPVPEEITVNTLYSPVSTSCQLNYFPQNIIPSIDIHQQLFVEDFPNTRETNFPQIFNRYNIETLQQ